MSVYHYDIDKFLHAKGDADPATGIKENKIEHANLSILIDDEFMNAVLNNEDIYLRWPVVDEKGYYIKDPEKWKIKRKVNAAELWERIMRRAYDVGDYGVLFYDNLNRYNNTWYCENIITTNPLN